jgi:hypothetical protein
MSGYVNKLMTSQFPPPFPLLAYTKKKKEKKKDKWIMCAQQKISIDKHNCQGLHRTEILFEDRVLKSWDHTTSVIWDLNA